MSGWCFSTLLLAKKLYGIAFLLLLDTVGDPCLRWSFALRRDNDKDASCVDGRVVSINAFRM